MVSLKISYEKITQDIVGKALSFPKYTTQIMNLANQNAQGTRPSVVGQMSELIKKSNNANYDDWVSWYKDKMPHAIEDATDKIYAMVSKIRDEAIPQITRDMVKQWVGDLVLTKTFVGFRFQESILRTVAEIKKQPYKSASSREESQGVDGYIGTTPVSIKRPLKNPAEARVPPGASCAVRFAGQGGSRRPAWRPPSIPLGGRSGHPPARPSPLRRSPPPSRADPPPGGGASRCASRSRRSPPGEAGSSPWEASSSAPGRGPGGA